MQSKFHCTLATILKANVDWKFFKGIKYDLRLAT
jgi:hypothetical protein